MQLLGKRYREANAGSRSQVVAYEPRPLLKLIPAPNASDSRIMTFTYIEAISKLNVSFSSVEIDGLLQRISPRLHSSLRSTLYVLTEDMLKKKAPAKKKARSSADAPQSSSQSDAPEVSSRISESESDFRSPEASVGQNNGRKRAAGAHRSVPAAKK